MNAISPTNQIQLGYQKGVRTTFAGYDACMLQWSRCRDVISGSDAVKGKKELYLPKLNAQQVNDYKSYVLRANFFNATARTISAMNGMLFRKEPTFVLPDNVIELLKNANLEGDSFEVFAREVINEVISVGKVGLFVDHTPEVNIKGQPLTIAITQQMGMRPFIKMYTAENILNWKYVTINSNTILYRVVLKEMGDAPIDPTDQNSEWSTKQEPNYRVLDIDETGFYRVRVFRIDKNDNDQLISEVWPIMNGQRMTFIPFEFLCPDGTDADYDEPPILDLVDINLSHYRTSADYEHGCHFTAMPTLWVAGISPFQQDGITPTVIYVGSQSALLMPSSDAKVGYAEFKGDGLQTLERSMDRKQAMMAVLGAKLLTEDKKAPETAFTTAMSKIGENSILASISIAASLGIQKCLYWFTLWANPNTIEDDIVFKLNKDFLPVAIDGPTLTSYVGAYQAGTLTLQDLFDLFQRADLIEAEVNYEEWQTNISTQQQEKQDQLIKIAQVNKPDPKPGIQNPGS